jgi:hypothetical protein
MDIIYIVHHAHSLKHGHEDVKMIGAFSVRARAEAAVARLSIAPGFKASPDGFSIDEYELDKPHWVEGFGGDTAGP